MTPYTNVRLTSCAARTRLSGASSVYIRTLATTLRPSTHPFLFGKTKWFGGTLYFSSSSTKQKSPNSLQNVGIRGRSPMQKDDGDVKVSKIMCMSNSRCDIGKGAPWIT